jgi:hypothetical protein
MSVRLLFNEDLVGKRAVATPSLNGAGESTDGLPAHTVWSAAAKCRGGGLTVMATEAVEVGVQWGPIDLSGSSCACRLK